MTAGPVDVLSGIARTLRVTVGLSVGVGMLLSADGAIAETGDQPAHIGSESCAACHVEQAAPWYGSTHALAWQNPSPEAVLGDFDDVTFEHRGVETRFTRRNGEYEIETQGSDGAVRTWSVAGVAGVAPLQQYLLETEPGRLQAFDIAWDVAAERWYHLYPDSDLPPGDGLHWTGPYKNWNGRCAECHATAYRKNYDPRSKTYRSEQAEIGVGCEACHGPGEAHAAWARDPASFEAGLWKGVNEHGLALAFDASDPEAEIQQCAGCHSRREPLGSGSPPVGSAFADNYRLSLLREGLYHADGQILDEVYVYGSFLQSKMHARGVRCTDCHESHSGRLKAAGNAVCTECHSPAGNSNFPTLQRTRYDAPEHHFHETGSRGAQCVACHMPERVYMGIDGRRDHSFRVPRPDLSATIDVPNTCNDCHDDHGPEWAAKQVGAWYPNGRSGSPHYGELFAKARSGIDDRVQGRLIALALATDEPGIVRATALDFLASAPTAWAADRTAALIEDADPQVRSAAIAVQNGASAPVRARRILPALSDAMRAVRVDAARALLNAPTVSHAPGVERSIHVAMSEYQASLTAKADFPEVQMAIGGTALTVRNLRAAERAFGEAASMDPQLVDAWMMVARLQARRGALDEARRALERGVAANPRSGMLLWSLGDFHAQAGRHGDAVASLRKAAEIMPENLEVLADLGMALSQSGNPEEASGILAALLGSEAETAEILYALASSFLQLGDAESASAIVRKLQDGYPASPHARQARELMRKQ